MIRPLFRRSLFLQAIHHHHTNGRFSQPASCPPTGDRTPWGNPLLASQEHLGARAAEPRIASAVARRGVVVGAEAPAIVAHVQVVVGLQIRPSYFCYRIYLPLAQFCCV
jgi:hypothetical protein